METTIEKVIHLQRIEMFRDIPSEQLAHLAAIAQNVRFSKGDSIFTEGDSSDCMYMLLGGEVEIKRGGGKSRIIKKDEAFGIWGFFDREPRLHSARATEDSYLFRIDHSDFYDLIDDRVHLSKGLIKFLVERIRGLIVDTNRTV